MEIHSFENEEQALQWRRDLIERDDYEYADNFRLGYRDDAASMADYTNRLNRGCCGYFDADIIIAGREAVIGFNYGH